MQLEYDYRVVTGLTNLFFLIALLEQSYYKRLDCAIICVSIIFHQTIDC